MAAESTGRCTETEGAEYKSDIEIHKENLNKLLVNMVANYKLLAEIYLILLDLPTSRPGVIREEKSRWVH